MTPKKLMLLGLVMLAASVVLGIVMSLIASFSDSTSPVYEIVTGAAFAVSVLTIFAGGVAWVIQVGVRGARD